MAEEEELVCPFCGYLTDSEYQIMLHMETLHSEGDSPFVAKDNVDDASIAAVLALEFDQSSEDAQYACCPVEDCGEQILLPEFDGHLELHAAEQDSGDEASHQSKKPRLDPGAEAFDRKLSHALRDIGDDEQRGEAPSANHQVTAKAWKNLLNMQETSPRKALANVAQSARRRLGKSELGPHAHEKQMPSWLVKLLETDGKKTVENRVNIDGRMRKVQVCLNWTAGILPVLQQLLQQDKSTAYAYLCDPNVLHISKLKREGGFCGYRNIQMMCSYIIGAGSQGHDILNEKIPTIFEIQDYIEHAWDLGINAQGREETGGIKGTRKYIGTPDAQAMFTSLKIACYAQGLKPKKGVKDAEPAHTLLFKTIEEYFINGCTNFDPKPLCDIPDVLGGHSMTIIGVEKRSDGSRNVLVFDPMFHDSSNVTKFIGENVTHKSPADLLKAYRRATHYLKRFNEFELLKLTPPQQANRDAAT